MLEFRVPALEPYKKEFLANNAAPEKYLLTTPLIFDFLQYLSDSGFTLDPETDYQQIVQFVRLYKHAATYYGGHLNKTNKNTSELQTWYMKEFYEPLFNHVLKEMAEAQHSPIEDKVSIPRLLLVDSGTDINFSEETAKNILLNYDRFTSGILKKFPKKYRHLAIYWNQIKGYYLHSEVPTQLVNNPENYDLFFSKLKKAQTEKNFFTSVVDYSYSPRSMGNWDDAFLREEAKFWRAMAKDENNAHWNSLPVDNPYLDIETFFKGLSLSHFTPEIPGGFFTERKVEWIIEELNNPSYLEGEDKLNFIDNVKKYITSISSDSRISLELRRNFNYKFNGGDMMFSYFPEYDFCFANGLIPTGYYNDAQISLFRTNDALKKLWGKEKSRVIAGGILANPNTEGDLLLEVIQKYPALVEPLNPEYTSRKKPPYFDVNNPKRIHAFLSGSYEGFIAKYKKPSVAGLYLEALSALPAYSDKDREDYRERLNALMVGTEYDNAFLDEIPPTYVIFHLRMFLDLPDESERTSII